MAGAQPTWSSTPGNQKESSGLPIRTAIFLQFDKARAHVSALCAGDGWLRNGANLILMGPTEYATCAHLTTLLKFKGNLLRVFW
ncbi:hypothetical protein QFZ91_000391 [Paraburkholderia sp. JPY419]